MLAAADTFDKKNAKLMKATKKMDVEAASSALEEMSVALLTFRTEGKLLGPDGGGDIPSVDDIRRSACRVQGRTFEKKIQSRDQRLNDTTSTATASAQGKNKNRGSAKGGRDLNDAGRRDRMERKGGNKA